MKQSKIIVTDIGPRSEQDVTPAVLATASETDIVVGHKYYFRFICDLVRLDVECTGTGMRCERIRTERAFEYAEQGKTVCVISSGNTGICDMTSLTYEVRHERQGDVEIIALLGIGAFQKAIFLLGALVGHDPCVISLSDLMTLWECIERRIIAAIQADSVAAVYNPKNEGRC